MFEVRSASVRYEVRAEPDALAASAAGMRAGVVIADAHFGPTLAAAGVEAILLEANEVTKGFEAIGGILVRLRKAGAGRNTHLWAVGGGAIQDAAAFVASIYMRGMAWTYLPTTLLGMVDSCIGGKSSINVGAYKNLVGTFHPPTSVLIDSGLTRTLSREQRIAGLAEAAKICYCRGADVFGEYLELGPDRAAAPREFDPIIELSLRAKKWFIEVDEFDRAERLLLNLGHTFGHALEGASGFRLSHGVAVGVGILCALELSGRLSSSAPGGVAPALEAHLRGLLASLTQLPQILVDTDVAEVFDRLQADKKHEPEAYRFVTFDADGVVQTVRLPRTERTASVLADSVENTLEQLST